jgi:hypothetical protein
MHARFKLVKAKADISNESESVKRFNKVGDDLGRIDLGANRLGGESTWGRNDLYSGGGGGL